MTPVTSFATREPPHLNALYRTSRTLCKRYTTSVFFALLHLPLYNADAQDTDPRTEPYMHSLIQHYLRATAAGRYRVMPPSLDTTASRLYR